MSLKVVTWNVEWAGPNSRRTAEILRRIDDLSPEVVCLTETHSGLLSQRGHTVCSQPDYGYAVKEHRRKVMLWSKEPWSSVDDVGTDTMPPGRFVSGVTRTSVGRVAVVGVCIPWFMSRAERSRSEERKAPWEDHEQYLSGLGQVLSSAPGEGLMVMGDFNQAIGPGSRAPAQLQMALQQAFPSRIKIVTSEIAFQGRRSIDHIALGTDWKVRSVEAISNIHEERKLSDHFGVVADLSPP